MSESVKELLKSKGLLAELEGCRNEEEAIKVLKRENLWGIINYHELEELKESYENGEIEADGTLSLGQLDMVAGGGNVFRKEKKQEQLNEGLGYAANAGVDADANLDPANAIEREEAERQEERERYFEEIIEQEQPELIEEDVQAWKEIEPIVKAIIEQNDGTLIINDLNPEDIFTNPEDPNEPLHSFVQQGGELNGVEFRLVSMNFGDKSEATYRQLISQKYQESYERDCNEMQNEIREKGKNYEENIENDIKSDYNMYIEKLSKSVDESCHYMQDHPFFECEVRRQGELMKFVDAARIEYNRVVAELNEAFNEIISDAKENVRETYVDREERICNEIQEHIDQCNEYLNSKIDGAFMRICQAPDGKTCFYMLDLECKMLKLKLMHHKNQVVELRDRYNSHIKEDMEQIKEVVKKSLLGSFENSQNKLGDKNFEYGAYVNGYTGAKYEELTGKHEENVDSANLRTRLNEHIMLSIDLANSRMKNGANCEAAELLKKVATIYVYLNDTESTIENAIEASIQFKLGNNLTEAYKCLKLIADMYSRQHCEKFYYKLTNKATKEEIYEIYKILFEEYGYIRDFVTLETEQIEASCKNLTGDILLEMAFACAGLNSMRRAMLYAYLASRKFTAKKEQDKCYELVAYMWSKENDPRFREYSFNLEKVFKDDSFCVYAKLMYELDEFANNLMFVFNDNERKEFFSRASSEHKDALFRTAIIAASFGETELAMECAIHSSRVSKAKNEKDECIEFIASMCSKEDDPTFEMFYSDVEKIVSKEEMFKIFDCLTRKLNDTEYKLIHDYQYLTQFQFGNRDRHICGNMLLRVAHVSKGLGKKEIATELAYSALRHYPQIERKNSAIIFIVDMWFDSPIREFRDCMGKICGRYVDCNLVHTLREKATLYAQDLASKEKRLEAGNKFYEIVEDIIQYNEQEMRGRAIRHGLCALTQLEKSEIKDEKLYAEYLRWITVQFRYYVREHNGEDPRRLLRNLWVGVERWASEEQIDRIISLKEELERENPW